MRILSFAVAMLCQHIAHAASVGMVVGLPDEVGVYLSLWPMDAISLDCKATLAAGELGATGHIPLAHHGDNRHNILVAGTGGYDWSAVHTRFNPGTGPRMSAQAGYGFDNRELEVRVLGGFLERYADRIGWSSTWSANLMVGVFF